MSNAPLGLILALHLAISLLRRSVVSANDVLIDEDYLFGSDQETTTEPPLGNRRSLLTEETDILASDLALLER